MIEAYEESQKIQAEKEAQAKEAAEKRKSWEEQCEGHVFPDGCKVVRGEVEDEYGNYMFRVPKQPVEDLDAWYKAKEEEWFECCE